MRRKIGIAFLILGVCLIASAGALLLYNQREDEEAGEASAARLTEIKASIAAQLVAEEEGGEAASEEESSVIAATDTDDSMPTIEIDGYLYIGYLTLPTLGLELPVMEEWDYERLRIAPCRYSGSYKTGNLVIAGHSYIRHFRNLRTMTGGETVYFTDVEGHTRSYVVEAVETLDPYAVPEMTQSEYELTLFTCTYGGQSRVAVRCKETTGF